MIADKGIVLSVGEGNNQNMARVAPIDNIDAVSMFYKIPKHLYATAGRSQTRTFWPKSWHRAQRTT